VGVAVCRPLTLCRSTAIATEVKLDLLPKQVGSSCIEVTYPCLRSMRSDYQFYNYLTHTVGAARAYALLARLRPVGGCGFAAVGVLFVPNCLLQALRCLLFGDRLHGLC